MVNKTRTPTKSSASSLDGDDHHIHNEILLGLPPRESDLLFPQLEFVRLSVHHTLHEPGDTLKSAWFCNSGLISILSVFPDGKSVEVGLVGKEGFIGLPLVAGFRTAPTRAIAQIEASAFRVDSDKLVELLRECPKLERQLQQFSQIMATQVTQIAACNRLHEVNERLARWLLMSAARSADRVHRYAGDPSRQLAAQQAADGYRAQLAGGTRPPGVCSRCRAQVHQAGSPGHRRGAARRHPLRAGAQQGGSHQGQVAAAAAD